MSDENPVDDVVWMVRGAWVSLAVRATCQLGVVDALDEPRVLADLAGRTGSDPATLARLMRVLVDLSLVDREGDTYVVTSRGEQLRVGHPSGVRSLALMQTEIPNLAAWSHLSEAVRSGEATYERLQGQPYWAWLAERPEMEATFNAAMARRADSQVAAVLAAVTFPDGAEIVDVGGGQGGFLAGLLQQDTSLHGIVADRPEVAAAATAAFEAQGLGDRAVGRPADFFAEVPGDGDYYLLSNVLHDWDDEECVAILRTVRAAMRPDSRLLVLENVLDAPGRSAGHERDLHLVDLHMLVMFGARERTKAEYDELLAAAGFAPSELSPSPNTWNVLATSRC